MLRWDTCPCFCRWYLQKLLALLGLKEGLQRDDYDVGLRILAVVPENSLHRFLKEDYGGIFTRNAEHTGASQSVR